MYMLLGVVFAGLNFAYGAGFTSHNTAARRTLPYEYFGPASETFHPQDFYGLARDRPDALQGGAPFPDYLYACGDEHDAGEEAHWTPFQMAAADYIRATYPDWMKDRNSDGAGLVAFMLGVTSHYIADINWHGLETVPSGEGLIRTMGYADFNCTDGSLCSTAHSAADTGGEFAAASVLNLTWYPQNPWYIPTEDLVNIYALMNASGEGPLVEPEWINECAVIFYAGSAAVSYFGDLIYPILAPYLGATLLPSYLDYPVGGIDDDAAWTGFMWNRFADWVANGPPDEPPNAYNNAVNEVDERVLEQQNIRAKRQFVQAMRRLLREYNISTSGRGEGIFSLSKEHAYKSKAGIFIGLENLDANFLYDLSRLLIDQYVSVIHNKVSEASSDQLLLALRDRASAIAARAPVHATNQPITDNIDISLVGSGVAAHEYFGTSVMVDGCETVIGSPGSGRVGGPQEGRVSIVNSCSNTSLSLHSQHKEPSYERFGSALARVDANMDGVMDYVICAPSFGGRNVSAVVGNYSGRCDIFLGPANESQPPAYGIYGDKVWGRFGSSVLVADVNGDGMDDIIISAPYAGSYISITPGKPQGDVSSQGAVYIFLAPFKFNSLFHIASEANIVLQPQASYQWFGYSLTYVPGSQPQLLIGAPVFHSEVAGEENSAVGRIYSYTFSEGLTVQQWSITGCSHAGRIGDAVAYSDSLQMLAISDSTYNCSSRLHCGHPTTASSRYDRTELLRTGRVLLLPLSALSGDMKLCDAEHRAEVLYGTSRDGRFGSTIAFTKSDVLMVAAPMAYDNSGEVFAYSLSGRSHKLLWSVSGSQLGEAKARLGSSLFVSGDVIYAGAPLANNGGNAPDGDQCGQVYAIRL